MNLWTVLVASLLLSAALCEEKAVNNTKWSTPVAERRSGDWVPLSVPCPTCTPGDASSQSSELIDSALPPQLFQQQQQPANVPLFPQQPFQPQLSPAQFQLLMSQLLQQANNGQAQFLPQSLPVLVPRQPVAPQFIPPQQQQPRLIPTQQQIVSPQMAVPGPNVASVEEDDEGTEEEEDGETEGKEEVQLLYVPVETLRQSGRLPQQKQKAAQYDSQEQQTTEPPPVSQQQEGQQRHRFQGQRQKQQEQVKQQQYEQSRRQLTDQRRQQSDQQQRQTSQQYEQQQRQTSQQYNQQQRQTSQPYDQRQQYQQINNRQRTSTSSTTPNPVHQPPLAVYMDKLGHDVKLADVINTLRETESISVLDEFGPNSPQIFVGPSNLSPPEGYAKFDIPYLSALESNRVERKVDKLPFFVAPLSFEPPAGYSKIPFPAPHVGSVVVANVSTDRKDAHGKSNEATIIKHPRAGQYSLPADLPPINPELPSLVNSLQDSRQPGNVLLVPATEPSQKPTQYSQTQQDQFQPVLRQQSQTVRPAAQYLQSQSQAIQSSNQYVQTPQPPSQYVQTQFQTPQPPTQYLQAQTTQPPSQYIQRQQPVVNQAQIPEKNVEIATQIPTRSTTQPIRSTQFPSRGSVQNQYDVGESDYQEESDIQTDDLPKQDLNFPRQESGVFIQQQSPQPTFNASPRLQPQQTVQPETPKPPLIQQQFPAENQRTRFGGQHLGYVPNQEQQQYEAVQSGFVNQGVSKQHQAEESLSQNFPATLQRDIPTQPFQDSPPFLPQNEQTTATVLETETTTTTVLQTTPSRRGQYRGRQRGTPVSYTSSTTTTTSSPTPRRNHSRGRRPTHSRNRNEDASSYSGNLQTRTRLEPSTTPINVYQTADPVILSPNTATSSFIENQKSPILSPNTPLNSYTENQKATILNPNIPINSFTEDQNQYNLHNDERKAVISSNQNFQQTINLELPNIPAKTSDQNTPVLLRDQEEEQKPNYYQYTTTTSTTTTSTTAIPNVPRGSVQSETDSFQSQRFRSQAETGRRGNSSRNQRVRGRVGNYQSRQRQPVTTTTTPEIQTEQSFNPYRTIETTSEARIENFPPLVSTVQPDTLINSLPQQQTRPSDVIYNQQSYNQPDEGIITTTESTAIYQSNVPIDQYEIPQSQQVLADGSLSYEQDQLQLQHAPLQQHLSPSQSQQLQPTQQQLILQFQESTTSAPIQNYQTSETVPKQPVQESFSDAPIDFSPTSEAITAARQGPKYTSFQRTRGRTQAQKVNDASNEDDVYLPLQQPSDFPSRTGASRQSATRSSYQIPARVSDTATTAADIETPKPVQVRLRGRVRTRQRVSQQQQESENYPVYQSRDTAKHSDRDQFQNTRNPPIQSSGASSPTAPHLSEDYSQSISLEVTTQPNANPDPNEGSLLPSPEEPTYSFSSTTAQDDVTYSTTTEGAQLYRSGGRKNAAGRGSVRRPSRPTTIPPTAATAVEPTTPPGPRQVYTVRPNKRPQPQKPKITTVRGRIRRPTTSTSPSAEGYSNYGTAEQNWNRQRFSPSASSNEVYDEENTHRGTHHRGRGVTPPRYQPVFISNLGRDQSTESNYYQFGALEEDETNPSPQWSSQQGVALNFKSSVTKQDEYEPEEGAESQQSSSRLEYTEPKSSSKSIDQEIINDQQIRTVDEGKLITDVGEDSELITTQVPFIESSTTEKKTNNSRRRGGWVRVRAKHRPQDIFETAESQNVATVTNILPATTAKESISSPWTLFNPSLGEYDEQYDHNSANIEEYPDNEPENHTLPAILNSEEHPVEIYNINSTHSDESSEYIEEINKESSLLQEILDDIESINETETSQNMTEATNNTLTTQNFLSTLRENSTDQSSNNTNSLDRDIFDEIPSVQSNTNTTSLNDESFERVSFPESFQNDQDTFGEEASSVQQSYSGTHLDEGEQGETSSVQILQNETSLEDGYFSELSSIQNSYNDTTLDDGMQRNLPSSQHSQSETSFEDEYLGEISHTQSPYNDTSLADEVLREIFSSQSSSINTSLEDKSLDEISSFEISNNRTSFDNGNVEATSPIQNSHSVSSMKDEILSELSSTQNSHNGTFSDDDIFDEIGSAESSYNRTYSTQRDENTLDQLNESNDINNETDDERREMVRISFSPPEKGQGYLPEQISNSSGISIHRIKDYQPNPVRFLGTSTSTEVSHETEICYRGRCVKTKTAADQIPME